LVVEAVGFDYVLEVRLNNRCPGWLNVEYVGVYRGFFA
jgi:hypothetical protein